MNIYDTSEGYRLRTIQQKVDHWNRWGPFLSERAWGTVREDYSENGDAWNYFPHDHARSRAYRWNEDGLAGICDRHQYLCFALALWNGRDPILKERAFGLTSGEGNHGEDVKDYYFYLDNTPTHSYMKYLYKYPQAEFPYAQLVEENRRRTKREKEYELVDTGIFEEGRYFDVVVEYGKVGPEDLLIRISLTNCGHEPAPIQVLPTLWFRNTWSWGRDDRRPTVAEVDAPSASRLLRRIVAKCEELGDYVLYCAGADELLFTENETNTERLFGVASPTRYVKDAFHDYVVNGRAEAVNPAATGTKAAARYVRARSAVAKPSRSTCGWQRRSAHPLADAVRRLRGAVRPRAKRRRMNSTTSVLPAKLSADAKLIARQAFAGMLWSKQYYHYVVTDWLEGDPASRRRPQRAGRGATTSGRISSTAT